MPAYSYSCAACGEIVEKTFPIGTAQRMMACPECGETARLRIGVGVNISAHALEVKGKAVRADDAREGRWNKDMPAYKRMRDKGLQPRQIDGSERLEDTIHDQVDIEMQTNPGLRDLPKDRFLEAQEEAQTIKEQAIADAS